MDFEFYQSLLPALTEGLKLSLKIIIPSAILGLGLGILIGAGRALGTGWIPRLLNAYVALFRGTPLVIQLFIWYYGLPNIAMWMKPTFVANGWPAIWKIFYLSPYAASIIAFVACSGAYHSEYIRGAILSIKRGQFQAASALGFTRSQTFWSIVAPQAIRRAWPGCGNEIIYLIKYSSLAFLATAKELTGTAKSLATTSFRFTETYFIAGLYYLILVTLATWLFRKLERNYAIPGFGH